MKSTLMALCSNPKPYLLVQEESAALLNQMFAQQMAGNAPYPDPDVSRALPSRPRPSSVLFDSRVMPSQPPLGMFDAHEGGQGGASEGGGGSRSSAPNPFEDLTRLPFKSQIESGKSSSSILASVTIMLASHALCPIFTVEPYIMLQPQKSRLGSCTAEQEE